MTIVLNSATPCFAWNSTQYQFETQSPGYDDTPFYRWRGDEHQYDNRDTASVYRGGSNLSRQSPSYIDQLPPGTYRPDHEVRTFKPQIGSYQFRPIGPEEQDDQSNQGSSYPAAPVKNQPRSRPVFRGDEPSTGYGSPTPGYQFFFRPDEKLDRKTRNYYQTPMSPDGDSYRMPGVDGGRYYSQDFR